MKPILNLTFALLFSTTTYSFTQVLIDFPCYTVSEDNGAPNVLFEYNPSTKSWTAAGITGGINIEAIATDPVKNIIYATDNGTFGIIDAQTAAFTPIGEVGSGNGDTGLIELNDVDGLTYDPVNEIMYGTHRVGGMGPGTNDVLFQIDIATGHVVPGAMLDVENNLADYAIIQEVFDNSFQGEVYDVDDIAYNPYNGKLYTIQNQDDPGALTELDPLTGKIVNVIYDVFNDNLEGMGISYLGRVYTTEGDSGQTDGNNNRFVFIDVVNHTEKILGCIDCTGIEVDFEAFDCFTAYNDLALKIEVDLNTQQPIKVGETITFQITIYNQGDFSNSDIIITNYMPDGVGLADNNWTNLGNGKLTYTLTEVLEPGANKTISITFLVGQGLEGQTITTSAEISSSFSPNILDVQGNLFTDPLPDLDSKPDDENNEIAISDNEINAGGPNAYQDEDDHDITIFEVEEQVVAPTSYNELTKFNCYTVSSEKNAPNILFEYNPTTNSWIEVGVTGGTSIEAIATDPITGIIYATDAGVFGIIDAQTALFNPIGEVGSGNGDAGIIELNDVNGLTYDPVNQIMYGVHRVEGEEPGTNDVLFQIDVATGQVIPGAMLDSENNPVDYVIIPVVFFSSENVESYDVDDIAYNTYTIQLFAIHNFDGWELSTIAELNPISGEVEAVILDIFDDYIEGIGFNYFGELFGTTGDNGITSGSNSFNYIDLLASKTTALNFIDPTNQHKDFEAFDCFAAYNDLALLLETESQQLINTGSELTFQLTIFNQGDFPNTNITITNYIPEGLILKDENWRETGNRKATYTFEGILEPGEDHTITIAYIAEPGFEGQTLTNTAEISSSYLPDAMELLSFNYPTDVWGNPVAIPDFDSQPDNENNETNVVDNEILGGGSNSIDNKDEDDHDIAFIEVKETYNELTKFNCYTVSSEKNTPNVLFEYNPISNSWIEVGVAGGTSIEAIATDPITGIIYTTDAGTFGTIDAQTALFTPIGNVGSGNGDNGIIELNDVDGLTYDPVNQIMYGTHRVGGLGPGTNDLLFQIDVVTGKVIPDVMLDAYDNPVDYAIIQEVYVSTIGNDSYDVDDIAYNVYTGQLFAIHNLGGSGELTQLDPLNGQVLAVIYSPPDDDLQGIGFTYFGELYVTSGDNGNTMQNSNTFIQIDLQASSSTTLNFIDPTNQHKDFEAFDCFTAYNDLALLLETESQQLANTGSEITFLLTIFNQGDFPNTNITITNYMPEGLILKDENWMDASDRKATYTFEGILEPGEDQTLTITYIAEPGFEGQTLTNTAEISSSYLPDTMELLSFNYPTNVWGNPVTIPDWDSQPDNENNETNVVDNDLNGGGLNSIHHKDEDDHDIALIQIQPVMLTVNPELCGTQGSAEVEILFSGVPPFKYKWIDANDNIVRDISTDFTTLSISDLSSGCYTVTVSDKLNQTSTFEVVVPSLSELGGNDNCDNTCPEYLLVPEGEMYGNFKAREIIEIKGEVKKTKTAVFDICE